MPDYEKQHSSGVAKAGLITGITGTLLGALNGADGLFGGRGGGGADYVCRHELEREEKNKHEHNRTHDSLVTKETLALTEKLAEANAEIAQLKAEKFTVATVNEAVAPLQTAISALETKAHCSNVISKTWLHGLKTHLCHKKQVTLTAVGLTSMAHIRFLA